MRNFNFFWYRACASLGKLLKYRNDISSQEHQGILWIPQVVSGCASDRVLRICWFLVKGGVASVSS